MTDRDINSVHDRAYALSSAAYAFKEASKAHTEITARLERTRAEYTKALAQMEALVTPAPHPLVP